MNYRVEVPKRRTFTAAFDDRQSAEAYAAALFYALKIDTRIIHNTPAKRLPAAPF